MKSLLAYSSAHFHPGYRATYYSSSTGQLALHLWGILSSMGAAVYEDKPVGASCDLLVASQDRFSHCIANNTFNKKVLFATIRPDDKDVDAADLVLCVGNQTVLSTYAAASRNKIVMLNYGVNYELYSPPENKVRQPSAVFSSCTLYNTSKGVQDLEQLVRLDGCPDILTIGNNAPVFLTDNPRVRNHGWIDNDSKAYVDVLHKASTFYAPSYLEGQSGAVLEMLAAGCLPVVTPETGIDEAVLAVSEVVATGDVAGHLAALRRTFDTDYQLRQRPLVAATMRSVHTWDSFRNRVAGALRSL